MYVVERDFDQRGHMRRVSKEQRQKLQGALPFYSVDTEEEAKAIMLVALERGVLLRQADGSIIAANLADEQTMDNLNDLGEQFAQIHERLQP